MLNNEFNQKDKNIFEQFGLKRQQYTEEEVMRVFEALKIQHGNSFSADEIKIVVSKVHTFLNEGKLRYYEATGAIYTSNKDEKDAEYEYILERETVTGAFTKSVMFYMISFIVFAIVFAAKQFNVLKSVLVIGMAFCYLELQILLNKDFELFIESWMPICASFAAFEKIVFLRSIFHFCIHIANGCTRVLVDAEEKFNRDDKIKFFQIMAEETRKVSEIVVNWDSTNYLKNELEQQKKEQEDAKNKKPGWVKTIFKWIVYFFVIRLVFQFISGMYNGAMEGQSQDGYNSDL